MNSPLAVWKTEPRPRTTTKKEVERKNHDFRELAFCEWEQDQDQHARPRRVSVCSSRKRRGALRVADAAQLSWTPCPGVMVQTEKVWAYAEEFGLARLIVVKPHGSRHCKFRKIPRIHPAVAGPNVRAHPDSHRRRKKIQGRCRPRYDEGISCRPGMAAQNSLKAPFPRMSKGAPKEYREKLVETVAESGRETHGEVLRCGKPLGR